MKKIILSFLMLSFTIISYSTPALSGTTGTIEFPDAYTLRTNNYTIGGVVCGIDKSTSVQLMLEGGFIPQVEAGLILSTKDTIINENLLKANIKFQFVKEMDNPAIAVGFVETKGIDDKNNIYGYIVASKKLGDLFVKNNPFVLTGGVKYNKSKETDVFFGMDLPIFAAIKFQAEAYTYHEKEEILNQNGTKEIENKFKYSFNLGGEFYTNEYLRTKIWWKEIDNTLGVSLVYIGIYK